MEDLTAKQITKINGINIHMKQIPLGTKLQDIIDAINAGVGPQGPAGPAGAPGAPGAAGAQGPQGDPGILNEIPSGTPINAVNATKTLTIDGVVIAGETVTIGEDVYEFAADTAQVVDEGNIAVDISAVTARATNGLTVDTNPTIGDKMTIGTKVFTFVPLGTANGDGEIDVEVLLADTQANIIAAIQGTDHNDPHPLVTCDAEFLNNILAITALDGGVAGNAIATTETFTAETNVFSGGVLANGNDCVAAAAVTALVAAITDHDTQGVGATAGAGDGDTVVLTADVAGVIGNAIEIGETMAHGAFADAAVLLSGGIDATEGFERELCSDGSYLYVCIADNTIADKNWRRIDLGSVY